MNTHFLIRPSIIESSFIHGHFVASNWNTGGVGYLDNFKILSILILTLNFGFPCALGLENLRKMPWCNYVTKLCFYSRMKVHFISPSAWDVYQTSTSENPTCSEPMTILRESNTLYHLKRLLLCRRANINIIVILWICELKKFNLLFEVLFHLCFVCKR